MLHRHLTHQGYTLAAIDNIIATGKWRDWVDLRNALLSDPLLAEKIKRICHQYIDDPYSQRYHFWNHYIEKK